jgi:hypothetical protein
MQSMNCVKWLRNGVVLGLAAVPLLAEGLSAMQAYTQVGVDEKLYQTANLNDPGLLTPEVWMRYANGLLYIKLVNKSPDNAGDSAGVLLTGVAFNLPDRVAPSGGPDPGSITPLGTTGGGWVDGDTGDEVQWGYDYAAGGASGGALAYAMNSYDTVISTLGSNGKNVFGGSAQNADGINYGIFSLSEASTIPDPYVKDALEITLKLDLGNYSGNLMADIAEGNVAAIFGSPTGTPVPDSGSTMLLLGGALALLGAIRRRV